MPKFLHIRFKTPYGAIDSKGGYTVAYNQLSKDAYAFAIAKCHEKDNFNKKLGRDKAAGRLRSKDMWDVYTDCASESEFITQIITELKGEQE